jgi:hypothetical protein
MEPHSVDSWAKILGDLPSPEGSNSELIMARRIIGDLLGYQHPSGNGRTRLRRELTTQRDTQELANALVAYGRLYFDHGVRP